MKRLGLTLITAVCLTATTFAAGNQPTTAKWDGNINFKFPYTALWSFFS